MKKELCVLLCMVLMIGLIGCGNIEKRNDTSISTEATEEAAIAENEDESQPNNSEERQPLLLSKECFGMSGYPTATYNYTYDSDGNLIKESYQTYGLVGNPDRLYLTYYDTEGIIVHEDVLDAEDKRKIWEDDYEQGIKKNNTYYYYSDAPDGLKEVISRAVTNYEYEENSNLIRETIEGFYFTEDREREELTNRTIVTYELKDGYKTVTQIRSTIENGKETNTWTGSLDIAYETDEKGRIVLEQSYANADSDEVIMFPDITTSYEYDEEGREITKEKKVDSPYALFDFVFHYQYDDAGNIVNEDQISDGELVSRHLYEYDETGKLITLTWLNPESGYEHFREKIYYEYDENGLPLQEYTEWEDTETHEIERYLSAVYKYDKE